MTTKQWLALIVLAVAISAAAGGLENTIRQEFNPMWQEGK